MSGPILKWDELETGTVKRLPRGTIVRDLNTGVIKLECQDKVAWDMITERDAEIIKLRAALEEIIPMCGNPNAVDACRLIANKCQGALK